MTLITYLSLMLLVSVWSAPDVLAKSPNLNEFEKKESEFCEKYLKTGDCEVYQGAQEEIGQESFLMYCRAEMGRLGCDQLKAKLEDTSVLKECVPDKICNSDVGDFSLSKCGEAALDMALEPVRRPWEDHQFRNSCATDAKMKKEMIDSYNKNEIVTGKFRITEAEAKKLIAGRNCDQIQAIILARGRGAIEDWNQRARSGDSEALKKIRGEQNKDRIFEALKALKVSYNCYTPKAKAELVCAVAAFTATTFVAGAGASLAAKKLMKKFGVSLADLEGLQARNVASTKTVPLGKDGIPYQGKQLFSGAREVDVFEHVGDPEKIVKVQHKDPGLFSGTRTPDEVADINKARAERKRVIQDVFERIPEGDRITIARHEFHDGYFYQPFVKNGMELNKFEQQYPEVWNQLRDEFRRRLKIHHDQSQEAMRNYFRNTPGRPPTHGDVLAGTAQPDVNRPNFLVRIPPGGPSAITIRDIVWIDW